MFEEKADEFRLDVLAIAGMVERGENATARVCLLGLLDTYAPAIPPERVTGLRLIDGGVVRLDARRPLAKAEER